MSKLPDRAYNGTCIVFSLLWRMLQHLYMRAMHLSIGVTVSASGSTEVARITNQIQVRAPMKSRYRWFVVATFFFFMLLHQSDKLLIGTLTPNIMDTFGISMTQMGAVSTGR